MSERIEMTVKMQVTPAQGLALQAMFEHWNKLSAWGASRDIAFFVDGDGNFHPKAQISFNEEIPPLTDELRKLAVKRDAGDECELSFDFDSIAWKLHG